MAISMDRLPPQNIEAEQSTLGAMMLDRNAIDRATEFLRAEDFYRPAHQIIFDALCSLAEKDSPVDPITLQEELQKKGKLEECGGIEYLISLVETVPSASNVAYYAQIVERKSILRKLIAAGTEIMGLAHLDDENIDDVTSKAEQIIFEVGQRRIGKDFQSIKNLVMDRWDYIDTRYRERGVPSGTPTGFTKIDQITAGLQPNELIILAARPSVGKTALALNMGLNAAKTSKKPTVIFSLEMSADQLVERMMCTIARANAHRLRTGFFQESEWDRLATAANTLYQVPIFIDDTSDINATTMRSKCRRLKSEQGELGLIVVDYLQLMSSHKKSENRVQEISEIARGLKSLAKELHVPVLALSQLSRAVEKREDKRPMLSDLRESGSIEAEADIVMMLYRKEYYDKKEEIDDSQQESEYSSSSYIDGNYNMETIELIIAKHRNGPTGIVKLGFIKDFASFENLAETNVYEN
ncbi:MAG: replicative DNA helicase [Armatimonadota bacterium]